MKTATQSVDCLWSQIHFSIRKDFSFQISRTWSSRARVQPSKGFTMRNLTEALTKLIVTNLAAVQSIHSLASATRLFIFLNFVNATSRTLHTKLVVFKSKGSTSEQLVHLNNLYTDTKMNPCFKCSSLYIQHIMKYF